MAYKMGHREQISFLPASIEDYVPTNDPVRVYDAYIHTLNIQALGMRYELSAIGHSAYDPKAMLKLLVYGYSYGIRSSRKLEQAVHHNLSFIWLMGGLKPDHKTIAEFRRNNKKALKQVFKECVQLCIKLNLIDGNELFVDGTKMRANASMDNNWDKERCEKYLAKVDEVIETLLNESENLDQEEQGASSLQQLHKKIQKHTNLKETVTKALEELKKEDVAQKDYINLTDRDSLKLKGRQGIHEGYNGQAVVDGKEGLIVQVEVVSEANDYNQFSGQINQANEAMNKVCKVAVADAGYACMPDEKKIYDQGIKVIVPSQRQSLHEEAVESAFGKCKFTYDSEKNEYHCPEGHTLVVMGYLEKKQQYDYRIRKASTCKACRHYGVCTKAKYGRSIKRLVNEELRLELEGVYQQESSKKVYKKRQVLAERPFGMIKRNLGYGHFLLRGLEGVNAEFSLMALANNMRRAITLVGGVSPLVEKMARS